MTTRVCAIESLPIGSTRQVSVDGHRILLCRTEDAVHAIDDTCPHEDVSLSLGAFDGATVRCPLHGSRFCVRTGEVQDPPAEHGVNTHQVDVRDGWIAVRVMSAD